MSVLGSSWLVNTRILYKNLAVLVLYMLSFDSRSLHYAVCIAFTKTLLAPNQMIALLDNVKIDTFLPHIPPYLLTLCSLIISQWVGLDYFDTCLSARAAPQLNVLLTICRYHGLLEQAQASVPLDCVAVPLCGYLTRYQGVTCGA